MPKHMGIIEKISAVLGAPEKFFSAVKSEKGVGESWKFYAVISLVPYVILGVLFTALSSVWISMVGAVDPLTGVFAAFGVAFLVGIYLLGLIGIFINAGILHIFALLFGARGGYESTFKASAYGDTPSFLLLWVPFVNILGMLWSLYLTVKGLSVLHGISMGRAAAIVLVPVVILLAFMAAMLAAASVSMAPYLPVAG